MSVPAPAVLVRTDIAGLSDFDVLLATNPKVTAAGSRFGDEVWDLSVEMKALRRRPSEKRLDFGKRAPMVAAASTLPKGNRLLDYPALHRHAKRFFAAMIFCPRSGRGPTFSATTLVHTLDSLRQVHGWLASEGYSSMEAVPVLAFELWVRHAERCTRRLLGTFRLIHLYFDLAPAFSFDPWSVAMATPQGRAYALGRLQGRQTEPIPDPLFRELLRVCLSLVQERAEPIFAARAVLAAERAERLGREQSRAYPRPACAVLHQKLWARIDAAKIWPHEVGVPSRLKTSRDIQNACRDLQYAAVALLFAITGMRLNELLTIDAECLKRTQDGAIERIWIESTHTKYANRAAGDQARWLCGSLGEQAVAVLLRLSAPTRLATGHGYLIGPLAESPQVGAKHGPTVYKGGSAGAFFSLDHGWSAFLRRHKVAGADGRIARIRTHQFRRTFARWCALSDSGTGLLALKDHYKHASILMTRHYARIDDELLLMFEAEKDQIRAESFDKVLRAEALGGIGGRLIKRKIDSAIESLELPREFRGLAGAPLRAECIKNWLQSGVQLRACAGHYCVPLDPHLACGETSSIGCNKGICSNAVFHPEHAPGLAEKISRDRETLAKMTAWAPTTHHVEELREHIRVQQKILADITGHETKTQHPA